MKLLDSSTFEAINSALRFETTSAKIIGRIESYSCKMAGRHKKLFKLMNADSSSNTLQVLSPPESMQMAHSSAKACSSSQSDVADLCVYHDTITQKTFSYLVSTLNASFPEYDFSSCKSEEFSRERDIRSVMDAVDNHFSIMGMEIAPLKTQLWDAINHEISLSECEIYKYNPDANSDPFTDDGYSWFCYYFFYNKRLKRVVFLLGYCIRKCARMRDDTYGENHPLPEDYDNDDEDDDDSI